MTSNDTTGPFLKKIDRIWHCHTQLYFFFLMYELHVISIFAIIVHVHVCTVIYGTEIWDRCIILFYTIYF